MILQNELQDSIIGNVLLLIFVWLIEPIGSFFANVNNHEPEIHGAILASQLIITLIVLIASIYKLLKAKNEHGNNRSKDTGTGN